MSSVLYIAKWSGHMSLESAALTGTPSLLSLLSSSVHRQSTFTMEGCIPKLISAFVREDSTEVLPDPGVPAITVNFRLIPPLFLRDVSFL